MGAAPERGEGELLLGICCCHSGAACGGVEMRSGCG